MRVRSPEVRGKFEIMTKWQNQIIKRLYWRLSGIFSFAIQHAVVVKGFEIQSCVWPLQFGDFSPKFDYISKISLMVSHALLVLKKGRAARQVMNLKTFHRKNEMEKKARWPPPKKKHTMAEYSHLHRGPRSKNITACGVYLEPQWCTNIC